MGRPNSALGLIYDIQDSDTSRRGLKQRSITAVARASTLHRQYGSAPPGGVHGLFSHNAKSSELSMPVHSCFTAGSLSGVAQVNT